MLVVVVLCSAARPAWSEEKEAQEKPGDKLPSIVGAWKNEVRHAVHWSLYQPVQGARLRDSFVYFQQDGDGLTGHSLTPDHDEERWNKEGRTEFRSVKFAKGRLVFEFDIDELHHGWRHRTKCKAWIRVEAELKGDRLIGKWGIFEKQSGAELFRGEWEAVRDTPPEPKPDSESERKVLDALRELDPIIKRDDAQPEKPVVAVQFRPNYGKVTDNDLAHLKALPCLRLVDVTNKQWVTDAGLAHLESLTELEDLRLNGAKVTPAAVVRFVKGRTKLKRLELRRVPLGDDDLAELKALTNLEALSLRGTSVTDKGLPHLKPFTRLRELSLMSTAVSDAGLEHLKALTALENLDLDRTAITDAGLAHLKASSKLRSLQMAHTAVTDAGVEQLHALSNLKGLHLRSTVVSKEAVDKLKRRLPELQVGFGPAPK
jgi:hypothetical protein